ncbi:MAG: hypothetical protein IPQ25_01100 [Chitinophagaceae bacterium]|nr:hypothetical protein [Chitinophagaceae bacterium]
MKHKFFENAEILLYYDVNKEKWYIKNKAKIIDYDLSLSDNLSSFLQIFYEDPSSFFSNLPEKAKGKDISEKALESLPFKTSIIFCIRNKMFFWLELSLKWLEYINVDDELEKELKIVVADPKFPQNIRHKLRKLLRTLVRRQGGNNPAVGGGY